MEDISKEELQAVIINLEVRLCELERNAYVMGYYDGTMIDTRTALWKLRKMLDNYKEN